MIPPLSGGDSSLRCFPESIIEVSIPLFSKMKQQYSIVKGSVMSSLSLNGESLDT